MVSCLMLNAFTYVLEQTVLVIYHQKCESRGITEEYLQSSQHAAEEQSVCNYPEVCISTDVFLLETQDKSH